jgi:AmmeMemoRadiSam system protein B
MTTLIKPATLSRPPAVAGLFYPDDPGVLRREVQQLVARRVRRTVPHLRPRH